MEFPRKVTRKAELLKGSEKSQEYLKGATGKIRVFERGNAVITRPGRIRHLVFVFFLVAIIMRKLQSHVFWAWSHANAICIDGRVVGFDFWWTQIELFFPYFLFEVKFFLFFFSLHFKVE